MSQKLSLQLLGPPQIALDGKPLADLTIGKAQGLLYYLAVTGRAHPREAISTLLWPDTSTAQARKNLRNLLPHLRSVVDSYLTIDRKFLSFDKQSEYWLDVEVLTSAFAISQSKGSMTSNFNDLSHAVDLYRGDFLDGFYLKNSPEFEAWVLTEREHLRELAINSMSLLVKQYAAEGEFEEGFTATKNLLSLDPWRETTYQQLMMFLAQMGNRSAALTQYALCQEMLADEFGVEPMPETTVLYEQIKAGVYDKVAQSSLSATNEWQDGNVTRAHGDKVTQKGTQEIEAQTHPLTPSSPHLLPSAPVTEISNNILVPLNPLIGREQELAYIKKTLTSAECRLLTITGLGGTGKTRLALELAKCMAEPTTQLPIFSDGVYFVSLLQLDTPTERAPKAVEILGNASESQRTNHVSFAEPLILIIAQAIGLSSRSKAESSQQLLNYLAGKELLLVLDNFEHLLPYCPFVQWLLQQVPTLKMLITSRTPLRIIGEWTYPLTGFSVSNLNIEDWDTTPACHLFLQRAQQIDPGFVSPSSQKHHIIQICQLVQGLPLGIELAASWLRIIDCATIARDVRFHLDTPTPNAGIDERHRTMRAVFEQAWQLLDVQEQSALLRLSVFVGNFTQDAAIRIGQLSLSDLINFVDLSLISVRYEPGSEPTYAIHELLRQHLSEKRVAISQLDTSTRQAHCDYYSLWLVDFSAHRKEHFATSTIRPFQEAFPNILRAWQWAVDQRQVQTIHALIKLLEDCCYGSRYYHAGWTLFDYALDKLGTAQSHCIWSEEWEHLQAGLLNARGYLGMHMGQYQQAQADLDASLALAQNTTLMPHIGNTLRHLAYLWVQINHFVEARVCLNQCLKIAQEQTDPQLEASVLRLLGITEWGEGYVYQAIKQTERSRTLAQAEGDSYGAAACLSNLGQFHAGCGAFDTAEQSLNQAIEEGDEFAQIFVQWNMAQLACQREDFMATCRHAQRSLNLLEEHDSFFVKAHVLNWMGHGCVGLADYQAAAEAYDQSRQLSEGEKRTAQMLESIAGLARVALLEHEFAEAKKHVETILWYINNASLNGADDRFRVYWTCYQVLADQQDRRALEILQDAYHRLQCQADQIGDENLRCSFLENIPSHRNLVHAFEQRISEHSHPMALSPIS